MIKISDNICKITERQLKEYAAGHISVISGRTNIWDVYKCEEVDDDLIIKQNGKITLIPIDLMKKELYCDVIILEK